MQLFSTNCSIYGLSYLLDAQLTFIPILEVLVLWGPVITLKRSVLQEVASSFAQDLVLAWTKFGAQGNRLP